MSTSSTSSSSLSTPITVASPASFTGVSKFASSLQSVLTRAESIAALPLNTLQATLTDLTDRQTALRSLDTTFSSLQESVSGIQTALDSGTLTAAVSDSAILSASVAAGAIAGNYTIEVTSLGAESTALSNAGSTAVTDPSTQGISTSAGFTLIVGGSQTTITPASTSLNDLVSAINSQAGSQVQATIVNLGSTSSPDYRLSLQAQTLGAGGLDLQDSGGNTVIASSTPGSLASYLVNGQTTPITSASATITLAPDLTVTLLGQSAPGVPSSITVTNSSANLASALSSFATSYNSAVNALAQYHGQNGGVLEGDSIINSLTAVLNQLGTYTNGSPTGSLANFGVTLDQTGQLSVDSNALGTAANKDFATFLSTLGSSTTGGFLQTASNALSGIEDANTGVLKNEETDLTNEISAQNTKITNEQASLNTLDANLTAQISTADSTIAELESQVTYVTGLFASFTGTNVNSTTNNGLPTL